MDDEMSLRRVTLGRSRVRESRTPGSVRAKAEWLSYSTTIGTECVTARMLGPARAGARRHPLLFGCYTRISKSAAILASNTQKAYSLY